MADRPTIDDKNRYLKLVFIASAAVYIVLCTLAFRIDWSIGVLPISYGFCYYILLTVTNSTLAIGSFVLFKATIVLLTAIFAAFYAFLHFDKEDGWIQGGDYTISIISGVFSIFYSIVATFYFRHYSCINAAERETRVQSIISSNPFDRIVVKERVYHIFGYVKPAFITSLVMYILMCLVSAFFVGWFCVPPIVAGLLHYSVMAIALFDTPYRLLSLGSFVVFTGVVSLNLVVGSFILMVLLHREMLYMIGGAVTAWLLIIFFLGVAAYFYRYYLFVDYQEKGGKGPRNESEMAEKQAMVGAPDKPVLGVPFPTPSAPPEV